MSAVVVRSPAKANPDRIVQLHKAGHKPPDIARRTGVSEKTVQRWLKRRLGDSWRTKRPIVTGSQRERARILLADQVPVRWITEDVNLCDKTVRDIRDHELIESDQEWKKIRLQIQHDPVLFALHKEFDPK